MVSPRQGATAATSQRGTEEGPPAELAASTPPPRRAEDFLSAGILEAINEQPQLQVADAPEPPQEPEPEPEEDEEPAPEEEAEEPEEEDSEPALAASPEPLPTPEQPQGGLSRQATRVLENPNLIENVPARQRPAVVQELITYAVQMTAQQTQQQAQQQFQQQLAMARMVDRQERLRTDDPDAFHEWEAGQPGQAAAFWANRAGLGYAATSQPGQPADISGLQARVNDMLARVQHLPQVYAAAAGAINAGRYQPTAEGVALFERDVIAAAAAAPQAPVAQRRQQAAAERATRPKAAPAGNGRAAAGVPTNPIQKQSSVTELLGQAFRQTSAEAPTAARRR